MKRYGNLFEKIVTPENIHAAYCKARRGRRWQNTVKNFERHLDSNLDKIHKSLIDKTFTTSSYREKVIYEPKMRTIYILPFYPDRIVQHAAMAVIAPIWDKFFIKDSYACRENKGMHKASKRVREFIKKSKYCLHCDISKFYPSIDHKILYEIIQRKIKCKDTLWLLKDIVYSCPGGKNTPIGNLTSQWFGNLYLNELDQWIKNSKRCKQYVRYCDDFIIFDNDKDALNSLKIEIEDFLLSKLSLKFSKAEVYPTSIGVDFVGYRHFVDKVLLRKSTAKRVKNRIKKVIGRLNHKEISIEQFRSIIASTEGWIKWSNSHNFFRVLGINNIKIKYGW